MAARRRSGRDPLRIFVGTSPGGQDAEACAALEHSLRSRAAEPKALAIERLTTEHKLCRGWRTETWATPWTALRWAVPEICGWRGRAVYFDCSQLILGDVGELRAAPISEGAFVLVRRPSATRLEVACLVFDCAAARAYIPPLETLRQDPGTHHAMGHMLAHDPRRLTGELPPGWGVGDREYAQAPDADARSVYFSSPHVYPHVPLARARLAREGRKHWFAGATLPHYCAWLADLWRAEYAKSGHTEAADAVES